VKQFDRIAEVQSDKANVEITSRYDGIVRRLHYGVGETARVGAPLVDIEVESDAPSGGKVVSEKEVEIEENILEQAAEEFRDDVIDSTINSTIDSQAALPFVKALPSVRKRAQELGISLSLIRATGKQGQITMDDLQSALKSTAQKTASSMTGLTKVVPLNVFQKAMVRSMTESIRIPHFGFNDEISIDRLLRIRAELNSARLEVKLTPLPFIVKALSMTLLEFPQLNAHFDAAGGQLILHTQHNIGMAVDTGHGLAVPVIKNVASKTVYQIAADIARLTELARTNKLPPSDLQGATLTVSNIGTIGGTTASPIIPHPQLVIVALGRALRQPRYDTNGGITPVTLMPVSWAADHRVVDGATIARFSQSWKQLIESPSRLLM